MGGQLSGVWTRYVQIVSLFFQLNQRDFYRYRWYKKKASEIAERWYILLPGLMFLIFTDQGEIGNIHKKKLSYDQHNSPFQNLNSNKKVCVE